MADKRLRRADILAVARERVGEVSYAAITMAEVAERAGLAKGTLYLYFRTKEELLLALLADLLGCWFNELDAALDEKAPHAGDGWTSRRLAQLAWAALAHHRPLDRLLTLLQTVLEHNIDEGAARQFKRSLLARLDATGARFERVWPYLQPGEGTRLLLHLNALLVGLSEMAHPAPLIARLLEEPALSRLKIDLQGELTLAIETYLDGVAARHRKNEGEVS